MKRKTKYCAIFFAILIFAASSLFWLFGTPDGARWLIDNSSRRAGIRAEIGGIEGGLIRGLSLEDVSLHWKEGRARIGKAFFLWRPWSLLGGLINIREVSLEEVTIYDDRPERSEPLRLDWPRISGLAAMPTALVDSLKVKRLKYQRKDKGPVEISLIAGRLAWRRGFVTAGDLVMESDRLSARGKIAAGFVEPSLSADLSGDFPKFPSGLSAFSLKTDLRRKEVPEQFSGPVVATLTPVGPGGEVKLTAEAGLLTSSIRIKAFRLIQEGRAGEVAGEGEVLLRSEGPLFRLSGGISSLDLAAEVKRKTEIAGVFSLEGSSEAYKGEFSLSNKGMPWESLSISGGLEGSLEGIEVEAKKGDWLGGKVGGTIEARWHEGLSLKGDIKGRNLDPSLLSPDWSGVINFNIDASLLRSEEGRLRADLDGRLLESRLRGRALTGEVEASFRDESIIIPSLSLRGKGFDIAASGELRKSVRFSADVADLSGLIPGAAGALNTRGWLRFDEGVFAGEVSGRGGNLSLRQIGIGDVEFGLTLGGSGHSDRMRLKADFKKVNYGRLSIGSAAIAVKGNMSDHSISATLRSPGAEIILNASGGYLDETWEGSLDQLSGRDKAGTWRLESPANLRVSEKGLSLSALTLKGRDAELMRLSADLSWRPLHGYLDASWDGINLARADQWLEDLSLSGETSGNFLAQWREGVLRSVSGGLETSGNFTTGRYRIGISKSSLNLSWDVSGLAASLSLDLAEGGKLGASLSSKETPGMAFPEGGRVQAEWHGLDLAQLSPLLPEGLVLKGKLSGHTAGALMPGPSFDVAGSASVSEGSVVFRKGRQELSAELQKADLLISWRGPTLKGSGDFVLKDYGHLRASIEAPLEARIPPSIDPEGPVLVSVEGGFHEKGLLTSLFPGLLAESRGEIGLVLTVRGAWGRPDISGTLRLSEAGAFLPAAGIKLEEVGLSARFEKDKIEIDSLRAKSGPGSIEGRATITLEGWRVTGYRGSLGGKNFQVVYLPDLQALFNPEVEFEGTLERLKIKGEILVPELTAIGGTGPAPVKRSRDVIIVDMPKRAPRKLPLDLDLRVRITLGEKVSVKAEGFDVRLGGHVDLTAESLEDIRGKGELRIEKGKYSAHGVTLDIERGRIAFDGPADGPALDVLAVKKVKEVHSGVLIGGTIESPQVKLYSRPPMTEPDIMAYIVLGHPAGDDRQQLSLIMRAATALLPKSDSVALQDQITRRIGLDTLDITAEEGGISRSMVTIGKYLTPNLYVSYGRSLFTDSNLLRLRYKLSERWEIETQSGAESGVDIFYKIELK